MVADDMVIQGVITSSTMVLTYLLWNIPLFSTIRFNKQLTHLPLDKMATIWADDIFNRIFLNEKVWILIKISLKFVRKGVIDNIQALV